MDELTEKLLQYHILRKNSSLLRYKSGRFYISKLENEIIDTLGPKDEVIPVEHEPVSVLLEFQDLTTKEYLDERQSINVAYGADLKQDGTPNDIAGYEYVGYRINHGLLIDRDLYISNIVGPLVITYVYSKKEVVAPDTYFVEYNTEGLSEQIVKSTVPEGGLITIANFENIKVLSTDEPIAGWATSDLTGTYQEFRTVGEQFRMPANDITFQPIIE